MENALEQERFETDPDEIWENFIGNQEFVFSLTGSQRMCYSAVYYSYETFVRNCIAVTKGEPKLRLHRHEDFVAELSTVYSKAICDRCWDDDEVTVARLAC